MEKFQHEANTRRMATWSQFEKRFPDFVKHWAEFWIEFHRSDAHSFNSFIASYIMQIIYFFYWEKSEIIFCYAS